MSSFPVSLVDACRNSLRRGLGDLLTDHNLVDNVVITLADELDEFIELQMREREENIKDKTVFVDGFVVDKNDASMKTHYEDDDQFQEEDDEGVDFIIDFNTLKEELTSWFFDSASCDMILSASESTILDINDLHDVVNFLCDELQKEQQRMMQQIESATEDGGCALCERNVKITKHHLIPRSTHQNYIRKGTYSRDDLNKTVNVCRQCHSAIHGTKDTFCFVLMSVLAFIPDNNILAEQYYSVPLLLERCDKLRKFVTWMAKQSSHRKPKLRK